MEVVSRPNYTPVYLARFEEVQGSLFRFDTRIYVNGYDSGLDSNCVGAIVGKNPGSAGPSSLNELMPLELNGDKMLPTVRNRFIDGYRLAGKHIRPNSFVRVWNLFYICDPDLNSACKKAASYQELPTCETEHGETPVVWYGWGGHDPRLNSFKERFLARSWPRQFFYDHRDICIKNHAPTLHSFAKHTQGMPSRAVNAHLAGIL
jgi:hypothetical protein